MSMWSKLKKAKKPGSGNYFNPGKYKVSISRVKKGVARDKVEYIAIETEIVEVLVNMDETTLKTRGGGTKVVNSNPVGSSVSQVIKFGEEFLDTALSNYMSFVLAALDLEESDVADLTEEEWDESMNEIVEGNGDALEGTLMIVSAAIIETRKGHDFVKVTWACGDENADEND